MGSLPCWVLIFLERVSPGNPGGACEVSRGNSTPFRRYLRTCGGTSLKEKFPGETGHRRGYPTIGRANPAIGHFAPDSAMVEQPGGGSRDLARGHCRARFPVPALLGDFPGRQ